METRFSILAYFLILNFAFAQLSPGDLHQVHKNLEGLKNCTSCHELGKEIDSKNCLTCHKILNERIQNKQGLHSQPEYNKCQICHIEHQGRDFELVYWRDGQQNFNHAETGFLLSGKHLQAKCRDCHRAKFIQQREYFESQGKDPDRTFLGLQQNCTNCHQDVHRQTLGQDCTNCHSTAGWRSVEKFQHSQTAFPLQGKHAGQACNKCHPSEKPAATSPAQKIRLFKIGGFPRCAGCHADVHQNKFGQNCQTCHSPAGWSQIDRDQFSHDLTAFRLEGKHRNLHCEKCHLPGKPGKPLAHQNCTDCHRDYHRGVFQKGNHPQNCADCHTVSGFLPATYSISDHNRSDFPLDGAHLAIPCMACHRTTGRQLVFKMASESCSDCHRDSHPAETSVLFSATKCRECHDTAEWQKIHFDHTKSNFKLQGKHAQLACRECHLVDRKIRFSMQKKYCRDCHRDHHASQFADNAGRKTACEKCHAPLTWSDLRFDHDRDTNFKLEGAHAETDCRNCHYTEIIHQKKVTRYRGISGECKDCHTGNQKTG